MTFASLSKFVSALLLITAPGAAFAATVGSGGTVNFGQTVVSNSCAISATDGSIGVSGNRNLITSDSGAGTGSAKFNGTLAAASISALSNLTITGSVIVETPTLSGGSTPSSSELKIGNTGWSAQKMVLPLGSEGELASTPVHVKFSPPAGSKFANGTYTASTTVTCSDSAP